MKKIILSVVALVGIIMFATSCTGDDLKKLTAQVAGWDVTEITLEDGSKVSDIPTNVYMVFTEEGRFAGRAGCNNMMGGYTVVEKVLTLTPIATTMMLCPNMEFESMFVELIGDAKVTFGVKNDVLILTETGGKFVMKLAKRVE